MKHGLPAALVVDGTERIGGLPHIGDDAMLVDLLRVSGLLHDDTVLVVN
ncbi:MAG: hypothetical protein ACOC0O_02230 [Spirochaetota bacterium]